MEVGWLQGRLLVSRSNHCAYTSAYGLTHRRADQGADFADELSNGCSHHSHANPRALACTDARTDARANARANPRPFRVPHHGPHPSHEISHLLAHYCLSHHLAHHRSHPCTLNFTDQV
jgi:hypothetical protein